MFGSAGTDGSPAAHHAAPPPEPSLRSRLAVEPAQAMIFAGARLRFVLVTAGASLPAVRWSLIGSGSLDDTGEYRAPSSAGGTSEVVAFGEGGAAAASVRVVAPPRSAAALAVVSCYDDGTIDVRDARGFGRIGTTTTGGRAAGIATNPQTQSLLIANGGSLGARFSEVAFLSDGFAAATDNNAAAGTPGVRIFRVAPGKAPSLVASAVAGDTPEGVAVSPDGRAFYITNVNGNSVMRFSFDGRGKVRLTATAATGHRPFGVALDASRHLLFVADNDTPTVSGSQSRPGLEVFSLPALRRIAVIPTGTSNALPLGVAADSRANRLFVTNEGDGTLAVYSISPLRRIASLPAGRTPWLPAIDVIRGYLFVPSALGNSFSAFDERTLRPVARDVPTCGYPTSIAVVN
jgi:DNA-binding beta-propeller fold protein YncE